MNGVHDMGGQQCFGPVLPEIGEPLFHAPWEKRALALTLAMGATGQWNIDLSRSARESLPSAVYLGSSYYEIWLHALELLMLERGLVQADEIQTGTMTAPPRPVARVLRPQDVATTLAKGSPTARPARSEALFQPGDRVRAVNMHPVGHTRLPRYVRGHVGTIRLVHGAHIFADAHASRPTAPFDDSAQWLYAVEFEARELWGSRAEATASVSVDAWEPYLEAA